MSTNLPSTINHNELADQLGAALNTSTPVAGEVAFMGFKKGEWEYGADGTEAAADSLWAVNPKSFVQGYILWEDEEVADEQLAQLGQPAPAMPAGADAQVGFQMLCIEGPDAGTNVLFKTSSLGGRKAVMALIKAIQAQAKAGEDFIPVVALDSDSYKHKKYGKIHTPVFDVQDWTTEDSLNSTPIEGMGEEADVQELDEQQADAEPAAEEKPKRQRRRRG